MVNEWIKPIYNRTYADIQNLMTDTDYSVTVGAYNDFDPNRVENNTAYVLEYMLEHKIIRAAPTLRIKTNWKEDEIIVASEMKRIVENVAILRSLSNPEIIDSIPELHLATQMNYILANDIEKALDIMHTQPEIPPGMFQLKLNDGIILTVERLNGTVEEINSNTCLMAEDEIAHIFAIPPEPDSEYKAFTNWSGNTDDLQYLENIESAGTKYTGQYHDAEFTANFKSAYPRKLSLTNAYVSIEGDDTAESGPRNGIYHAGDKMMIIADIAPIGKKFYCWEGTEEALDAISVSDADPSTIWLVMPDIDVKLWPRYINAGQHYVEIINGSGSGWYDYDEDVNISASVPENNAFDNWSGDTKYLKDIHSGSTSFKMPDVDVTLRAHWSYVKGYYNVQIINGLIRGEDKVEHVQEGTSLPLTPLPPDNYGLDYWKVDGPGGASSNYFTVGHGNAVITGMYVPYCTVTLSNINNNGQTTTSTILQKRQFYASTNRRVGDYVFDYWDINGVHRTDSGYLSLIELTINIYENTNITAVYKYSPVQPTPPSPVTYYTLTIINQNNDGETTIEENISSGSSKKVPSRVVTDDAILIGYYFNGEYHSYSYLHTQTYTYEPTVKITSDSTIRFVYRPREYRTLTVINGTIGDTGSSTARILELNSALIVADEPGSRKAFDQWVVTSGQPNYPQFPWLSPRRYVQMALTDIVVEANYKDKVYITVHTYSGEQVYDVVVGKQISVSSSPYPELQETNKWNLLSGDAVINSPYSSGTYITAVSQDSEVEVEYRPIPWFMINVINGYVKIGDNWVESGEVIRGSNPEIKMKPAPTGNQFLQWEVLVGNKEEVLQPLAEHTTLRNVVHDVTVRATYYVPDPNVKYTLTIIQKDGTVETYSNPVGTKIDVSAYLPDEGYRFYRWDGDFQYLVNGRYVSDNIVNMPERNIELTPTYVQEDYVTKYHLYMYSAECLLERTENEETHEVQEVWGTDGEFEEGTIVEIRPTSIPFGWKFDDWEGETPEETALVRDKLSENTCIVMSDFDVHMSATIIEELKYTMKITNGQTSGEYYGNARVDVYFDKESTDTEHYAFTRWTGEDLRYISLYDGGVFDVTNPGSSNEPQYIKMPLRRIEITGEYTTAYKLSINGGHIDGTQEEYFAPGTRVNIAADIPEGYTFQRWEGNTDGIGNIYDPTTYIVTNDSVKNISAICTNDMDRNSIGYVLISLIDNDIINIENINVIAGEIELGFILTDITGHFYVITELDQNIASIARMTKIVKGGEVYE